MNTLAQTVISALADQRLAMEAFLKELVNTDSNSRDQDGTNAVADAIETFFKGTSAQCERFPHETYGDTLRITLPAAVPSTDNSHVLCLGHRDTVFPKGTTETRGYSCSGNYAYGPGVADMKGGLVLTCFAIKEIAKAGGAPFPIVALFTPDEEIGSPSSRPHIEAAATNARAVFNAEPGRKSGNVVHSRKGGASIEIKVTGVAAHSGVNHAKGCSAIDALAKITLALHALTNYETGITTNMGLFEGGVTHNTVAPFAKGKLDLRFMTLEQFDEVKVAIDKILTHEHTPGTHVDYTYTSTFLPLEAKNSLILLEQYKENAAKIGFKVDGEFTGGCADSGFTSALGLKTLCGLGPVGDGAHTDKEVAHLDTLVPRVQALAATILDQ